MARLADAPSPNETARDTQHRTHTAITHYTQQHQAIQFSILPNWVSFPKHLSQITPSKKIKQHQGTQREPTPQNPWEMQAMYWKASKMCCCNPSHTTEVGTKDTAQHESTKSKLYSYAKHKNTASIFQSHADTIRISNSSTTHFFALLPSSRNDRITPARTKRKTMNYQNKRSCKECFHPFLFIFRLSYFRLSHPLHI
jgi:hypothetical protein